jgi:uncharacterized protein
MRQPEDQSRGSPTLVGDCYVHAYKDPSQFNVGPRLLLLIRLSAMSVQAVTQTMATEEEAPQLFDPELPILPFDQSRRKKTLDFGSNGLVCSVGILGDLISLSIYHPQHGIVVANPFEQFPGGDAFWDSGFVREYRKKFLQCFDRPGSGFGLRARGSIKDIRVGYIDGRWPRIIYHVNGIQIESNFLIIDGSNSAIVNSMTLTNSTCGEKSIHVDLGGKLSVHRASYGQLTEAGPIPIPQCLNRGCFIDGTFAIKNSILPASFDCSLYTESSRIALAGVVEESSEPISFLHSEQVTILPGNKREINAVYRLRSNIMECSVPKQISSQLKPSSLFKSGFIYNSENRDTLETFVIRRTFDYLLSCCCIPIELEAICVLTDHIALPLGWHRDN